MPSVNCDRAGVTIRVGRIIAIGDVHGCLDELQELLASLCLQGDDWLVFLGDLVDRGPMPVEAVRFVMELRSKYRTSVLRGNHEAKLLLWRQREEQRLATGRENKMRRISEERQAQWREFTNSELVWMRNLPYYLELPDNWVAVHAGFIPGVPLEKQDEDKVIRLRTLWPETGLIAQQTDESAPLEDPPGSVFWTTMWKGPYSVVYGHAVTKGADFPKDVALKHPRVDRLPSTDGGLVSCLGLDTGCCFGGVLTAAELLPDGGSVITQVQSKAEYAILGETR